MPTVVEHYIRWGLFLKILGDLPKAGHVGDVHADRRPQSQDCCRDEQDQALWPELRIGLNGCRASNRREEHESGNDQQDVSRVLCWQH